MEWFKDLKIASKLYLMVAVASFLILLTSIIGYTFNHNAAKSLESMYKDNLVAVEILGDIRGNLMRALADSLNLMQNTTPSQTAALSADIKKMRADCAGLFDKFLETHPTQEQRDVLTELKQVRLNFWGTMDKSLALAVANKNYQAYKIYK